MQVLKFAIRAGTGEQTVMMPQGARPLTVQLQQGQPMLWALCDESAPQVARILGAHGTGDTLPRVWPYIATLQTGAAVVHYFDHGETRG